jgi:hypothetical protein
MLWNIKKPVHTFATEASRLMLCKIWGLNGGKYKKCLLECYTVVRTDISKERIASIIRVTRIGELGITLAVISNPSTLRRNSYFIVRFEVFTSVTMKNAILWRARSYGSCKIRRLGGTYLLHLHGDKNLRAMFEVTSTRITLQRNTIYDFVTLMMEAIRFSETWGSYKSHTA